ncbi:K02A2.6-like [Cordylochernes scorpioides]|uniref:K02A2.6-like n=1 Tax=Cordylochernes scorpioides TaxID=51811 RepID=A0ABY6KS71_9ARAC|nr:K02A2.6-like [Cordylochernes scorpioides]
MDDVIIGLDILRNSGFCIDLGQGLLCSTTEEIPLKGQDGKDVEIPVRNEYFVRGELETSKFPSHIALLKGSKLGGGVIIVKELIDTQSKSIPAVSLCSKMTGGHSRERVDQEVIEPSFSLWTSPVVLGMMKYGSICFCVDYQKLNGTRASQKYSYPLSRIDTTFNILSGSKWFSTFNLKSGYWQVEMYPNNREKIAF